MKIKTAKQARKEIAMLKGCKENDIYIFDMQLQDWNGKTRVEYAIENSGDNEIKEIQF